ncbi:hypothetical protein K1X84_12950 [bacterium]|nr:hypothetical protein [bacterium]
MMEATLEESRNYLLERREEIIQKVRYLIKQTHNPTRDEVDNKLKLLATKKLDSLLQRINILDKQIHKLNSSIGNTK